MEDGGEMERVEVAGVVAGVGWRDEASDADAVEGGEAMLRLFKVRGEEEAVHVVYRRGGAAVVRYD